jgi:DNA replication protein DnaC
MSFHSLEQLKQELAGQLEQYNAQPFQIGHQCCQMSFKTLHFYRQRSFLRLKKKKADGSYIRKIGKIEQYDLLILDDFGMLSLNASTKWN